ncbi:ABC transporter permease [Streptomyces sp. NBC_01478]|uniref:ABC transporter permease n=1 Tax=Streptomyces sp. NBC_01478 TaxID=2903882 RepID=UPI002E320773|nr:ABC transporter permease [Streptomyces sp. NBC_01478]
MTSTQHTVTKGPDTTTDDGAATEPSVPAVHRGRSLLVTLAYTWLAVIVLAATFADILPLAPYDRPIGLPRQTPGLDSLDLLLGTDQLGRSLLSRCVYGARVSLLVGAGAGLIGSVVGTALGMVAGYLRGRTDSVIRLIADAMLAFPPLILLLALAAVLTPSVSTILIGLTLLVVPTFIRLARANTLSWASREFITAARNMGASRRRILAREILPNLLPALGAYLPVVMAALIAAEGSLSFLGMGIPPPSPSWGGMISDGKDSVGDYPHLVFVPTAFIFLTVFALNQAGDHLRHRFDRDLHD